MTDLKTLRQAILEQLQTVIDPETGVDVVRMRLIEELIVDDLGNASCRFRPSAEFCPLAVPLSLAIREALLSVPGVTAASVEVVGFTQSEELTAWLKQALGGDEE